MEAVIKAVLFDLDGTLLDRQRSLEDFISGQCQRLKHLPAMADEQSYKKRFLELDAFGMVWKDKVYQSLVTEFAITALDWQALLDDYIASFSLHCIAFPGIKEALTQLKKRGYKLGIITNARSPFQERNIAALGIEDYFSTILVSGKEGIKKPEAAIFQRGVSNLDVHISDAIYVGDHPHSDIDGAQKAGMKTIWKKNDIWRERSSPDAVFENFTDLPGIVESLFAA
jgi:putative hydrolase of the HAD superfamily